MVTCAMLAAIYTAVSFVLAPISYGSVQIRVAEAMTLLPVFAPSAVFGVTLWAAPSRFSKLLRLYSIQYLGLAVAAVPLLRSLKVMLSM